MIAPIKDVTDRMLFVDEAKDDMVEVSLDTIEELMIYHDRANANVPHTPESTTMTIAALLKKKYAFNRIFSPDCKQAHISGDIHIHDLDLPDRPYCSGHSPAYVAKYGLHLPGQNSGANPAKYADVYLEQLIKFAACMQGHFSGAIGFDAVNMFLAPYLVGLNDKQIKQLAQILVFEFSQQAVARGGQVVFSDLNLYWGVPKHYANVEAIGPGGISTGIPYKEYADESKRFFRQLMQVYYEGDSMGRPFFFPKADCHITQESVNDDEYLNLLGKVTSKMGSPYFIFDRGNDPSVSQCCRLKVTMNQDDLAELNEPWKVRFAAIQNVTMNLPGQAYRFKNDETAFYDSLSYNMDLAAKAHTQKMDFITRLIALKEEGPLNLLNMNYDGLPYLRDEKCKFLIGMVGLNEAVQILTGEQLHESKSAVKKGIEIIAFMNKKCKEISDVIGYNVILEQTPAESTAYRLAKIDMTRYGTGIRPYIRGNAARNDVYYTNSTQLNISSDISPIERIKLEGKYHPLIDAGAITHVWLGESEPPAEGIANLVRKIHANTNNAQVAFSPEFTTCFDCSTTSRGLHEMCPHCGSSNINNMTRVTGFYSVIQGWNKGKRQELIDRARTAL